MHHHRHIALYYWHQWICSGGQLNEDGRPAPRCGNNEWFHKYWRECDLCWDRGY